MQEVFLSGGAHATRQDGMCAMEFGAYLAGLEHTARPECVSPVLLRFMISLNDSLDDKERQKLRPYIVRTLGTSGDGQDQVRAFLAADWAVRVCAPMALSAAGFYQQAEALRNLNPIVNTSVAARAARAARAVYDAYVARAAYAAYAADALYAAVYAATDAAADGAYAAAAATDAAADGAYAAAAAAAAAAANAATYAATYADVAAADAGVWESCFHLLDRMIDPGGLHDVKTEEAWLRERSNA